jgi:hypothetical protein
MMIKTSITGLVLIAFASFAVPIAEGVTSSFGYMQTGQGKVAVRPEDLPESIKSTLSGDDYAEWKVTSAYLVTKENNSQYYEVNLKKGEETTTINFDKYGRKVD